MRVLLGSNFPRCFTGPIAPIRPQTVMPSPSTDPTSSTSAPWEEALPELWSSQFHRCRSNSYIAHLIPAPAPWNISDVPLDHNQRELLTHHVLSHPNSLANWRPIAFNCRVLIAAHPKSHFVQLQEIFLSILARQNPQQRDMAEHLEGGSLLEGTLNWSRVKVEDIASSHPTLDVSNCVASVLRQDLCLHVTLDFMSFFCTQHTTRLMLSESFRNAWADTSGCDIVCDDFAWDEFVSKKENTLRTSYSMNLFNLPNQDPCRCSFLVRILVWVSQERQSAAATRSLHPEQDPKKGNRTEPYKPVKRR